MIWDWLIVFFIAFVALWVTGGLFLFYKKNTVCAKHLPVVLPLIASILLLVFIVIIWIQYNRPPMKTMAETRLLYSFFVSLITWFIVVKTRSSSMYLLGFVMASVFLLVDIAKPEYQSKNLMPALQSVWFVPHVVIYMAAYAVLAAACLSALKGMWNLYVRKKVFVADLNFAMSLIYPGFALLTLGMLLGAIWAKIAWGNYWSFDPKETWALLTWLFYLFTMHAYLGRKLSSKTLLWLLALSFIVLVITWMGIRYLPAASHSIHVY